MRKALLAAGLLAMGLLVSPAHADPYRYCAVYGGAMSGSENCYFMTLQQCRVQVSGVGGLQGLAAGVALAESGPVPARWG